MCKTIDLLSSNRTICHRLLSTLGHARLGCADYSKFVIGLPLPHPVSAAKSITVVLHGYSRSPFEPHMIYPNSLSIGQALSASTGDIRANGWSVPLNILFQLIRRFSGEMTRFKLLFFTATFTLIESEVRCLTQGRLPQILPRYEGIRDMFLVTFFTHWANQEPKFRRIAETSADTME